MKMLVVLSSMLAMGLAQAAKWDKSNNPNYFNVIINSKVNTVLADLPLTASLEDDRYGWSDSYWPSNLGGIAYRWNHPNPTPFKYKLYSRDEVKKLSEKELSELSPAELYDIAMGDYNYTLTKKVLKTYSPQDLWWEGICHGWALAAANYPEPDQSEVINKDGIKVNFGASDVKALLSMHDAYNSKGIYARIGARCGVVGKVPGEAFPEDGDVSMPSARDAARPECADVNAGAFHVVLTNLIGIKSQGFVVDVDRFNDVWNQPVTGYESTVMNELPVSPVEYREGVDKKVRVVTLMHYGDELDFWSKEAELEGIISFVSKQPVTGTNLQVTSTRRYEYVLEIDSFGKIVGGEWISDSRPDMVWSKVKDAKFLDGRFPLAGLNKIYRPVTR